MRLGRLDVAQILEQDIGHFHRHAAEIGYEVRAGLVARERAFCLLVIALLLGGIAPKIRSEGAGKGAPEHFTEFLRPKGSSRPQWQHQLADMLV